MLGCLDSLMLLARIVEAKDHKPPHKQGHADLNWWQDMFGQRPGDEDVNDRHASHAGTTPRVYGRLSSCIIYKIGERNKVGT